MMLALNMIVRNESSGIVQTLESCKHLIDSWDIVDTGSTDNTSVLIEKTLQGIPGTLHHLPFVDYSTTRNAALDLCKAPWALLLSGDELVQWADRDMLHAFLRSSAHAEHPVTINFGTLKFQHLRLVRPAICGRYVGVTHEVIPPRNQGKLAPFVMRSGRAGENRTARWEQDCALLEAELPKGDPRTTFYLAQTYECLGLKDKARDMYLKRILGGVGYVDEHFSAMLRVGRLGATMWLHAAAAVRPHRAEPLFYLAEATNDAAMMRKAADMPPSKDGGFVEMDIQSRALVWLEAHE